MNTKVNFQQEPPIADNKNEETGAVMREVATLGEGKSFGELALIRHKPRAATVKCIVDTHFATLVKNDYEISLAKIERKHMQKMIDFLMQIPCFKGWT